MNDKVVKMNEEEEEIDIYLLQVNICYDAVGYRRPARTAGHTGELDLH
jgi:hypothetical protein